MADKPVIYVFGDSPTAHTGFGRVNKEIWLRLKERYDLFFLGLNYHGDPFPETKIFNIFPTTSDPFGQNRFPSLFYHYRPDMLFTLNDYDAIGWAAKHVFEARQKLDLRIPWCFTGDHDVITKYGIKNIKNVKVGDQVLSICPETEKVTFKKVISVTKQDYDDDLVNIKHEKVDFCVTKDHHLYLKKNGIGRLERKTAIDLYNDLQGSTNSFRLPTFSEVIKEDEDSAKFKRFPLYKHYSDNTIVWLKPTINKKEFKTSLIEHGIDIFSLIPKAVHGHHLMNYDDKGKKYKFYLKDVRDVLEDIKELDICEIIIKSKIKSKATLPVFMDTRDLFSLIGWYVSEGSSVYDRGSLLGISICQDKKVNSENYTEIVSILKKYKIKHCLKRSQIVIYGSSFGELFERWAGRYSINKKLPDFVFSFPNSYLEILFRSLCKGDGTEDKRYDKFCSYYSSSEQLIKQIIVLCAHIGIKTGYLKKNNSGVFQLCFINIENTGAKIKEKHVSLSYYRGEVYCCTVENNHTILAGRNNKFNYIGQCFYFPVDSGPVHPEWASFMKDFVTTPVTVTKYGREEFKKTDPTLDIPYVYHGVNTALYRKMDKKEVLAATKEKYKDKFVVLMVGQNQLRKQYNIALEAFADFAADKKDVVLHFHCAQTGEWGWNLPHLANMINLRHEKEGKNPIDIAFSSGVVGYYGWHEDKMPILYNMADVFLSSHCGEGFCIPIVEAMSCELPVIAHGTTAIPEIVEDAGILTKTAFDYIFPTRDRNLIRHIPDKADITRALNELYEDKVKRQELAKKGRMRVVSDPRFSWDFAAEEMDKHIQETLKDDRVLDLSDQEIL